MDSATLEQENLEVDHGAAAETATGPRCEKCEQPLASELATACPHCGWYASIGAYVEIEPQWEAAVAGGGAPAEQKTFLEVWTGIIPAWVWINWACGTTAIVLSIVARVAIQDEAFRSTWSVTQLFAGMGLALACHIAVFVMMAMDDPDLGLGDIVVSPLKGWRKLFAQMPRRQVVACTFNFAMSAAVGAMMIIGGIPYERVLEWGIRGGGAAQEEPLECHRQYRSSRWRRYEHGRGHGFVRGRRGRARRSRA